MCFSRFAVFRRGHRLGRSVSRGSSRFSQPPNSTGRWKRPTAGQPVMVDFYADWCISCKELERFTFSDPRVVSEFAHWKLLRIDVTKNTRADAAMLRRFGLFGPPALIFYDHNGHQQVDAQLSGSWVPTRSSRTSSNGTAKQQTTV
jgi:thioredoxin:protein disulfide reductase